ncbi:transcription termination factor, mitochondrial [Anoplophora glabripennis]|uniref:transcription termination factor, mitochondrial n=1 Tax=Anoplophora glabripennis TaxID=217634 RepID=UPI000873F77B|nr:transcription termination factor, mitochondrial [Anoplophora glabripennis]
MLKKLVKIFYIDKKYSGRMLWNKDALVINNLPSRLRFLSSIKKKSTKIHESLNSIKVDDKASRSGSAKILEKLLGFKSIIAKDIVLKNKKFHKISVNTIVYNFTCSLENGILPVTLEQFPEVLAELDLPLKISELKELPYDVNITAPLLSLPYQRLKTYTNGEIETNRIALISEILLIEKSKVCQIFAKKNFLLSLNLNQLLNNIKLLTDNGITKDEIIKDLWVLRYSTSVIEDRLDTAKRNGIDSFKTWMVRAQPEIFETYIRRRSDNKLILGDSSLTQYLSERLECTEEVAKYIISKQPALQNKSLKKMNEMIEFLFKHGFKPIHICRIPKILLHGVETTRKRLKELEATGMQLDSLYLLTKSQRQYLQYYELLVKSGKNKLKNT